MLAAGIAAVAAVLTSTAFSYLRRSESVADVDDVHLTGAIGRVVLPVAADRRGRVVISVDGQQRHLSARVAPGTADALEVGAPVLVIELHAGIAVVARLDPELT